MSDDVILNRAARDCAGKDYQERVNRTLELALGDGRSQEDAETLAEEAQGSRWDR